MTTILIQFKPRSKQFTVALFLAATITGSTATKEVCNVGQQGNKNRKEKNKKQMKE